MAARATIHRVGICPVSLVNRSARRAMSDGKGRILSEEEQAAENVYIKKMEKERLEKLKQKKEKEEAMVSWHWKQIGKAILTSYAILGAAWLWNETSPLGWWTLKPRTKEEKSMAHLYERRQFPYPGDKEAVEEFIAKGGFEGTEIGPKGLVDKTEGSIQKKLQQEKFEKEAQKLWLRMRNEVISDLQDQGYEVE